MYKIAFFEITGWEKDYLQKKLSKDYELIFFEDQIQDIDISLLVNFDFISVFIYSRVTSQIIDHIPNLKMILTRSTGFDHIDTDYAETKGIPIKNVPFYGENTVAEHTFALILSLSRNVHKSYSRSLRDDFSIDGLMGFDLKDKTIGIIGGGHIGQHVIRIAKGFGMNVLVYDITQDNFLSEVLDYEYVDLNTLLKKSDIISLHVPYNKNTHHLINLDNISQIKKGAILINTSRGGLVDIDAITKALDLKILAGAGLDVLEGEELIHEEQELLNNNTNPEKIAKLLKEHLLIKKDNVVFTPHIAFYSKEAILRILDTTIQNIKDYA
jgi:D-lactate dehydrogenase